ncbi:MAG: hypothetical protein ACOCSK_03275 [Rhodothermales bacterium]
MANMNKAQKRAKREIYSALGAAQSRLNLDGRFSRGKGVPHLVGTLPSGRKYSVCYFRRCHSYAVFFPYAEFGMEQRKSYVQTPDEIEDAVEKLVDEVEQGAFDCA